MLASAPLLGCIRYNLAPACLRSAMTLSLLWRESPRWKLSANSIPFVLKYASARAFDERASNVNTAASPMPEITEASGPLVFVFNSTPCWIRSELKPCQAFDASMTVIVSADCPYSLVLGPQL